MIRLAVISLIAAFAWLGVAQAQSCTTYRIGDHVYTNCSDGHGSVCYPIGNTMHCDYH